jgi:MFS family permease
VSTAGLRPSARLAEPARARAEWRVGWPVVLTGLVGYASVSAQTQSLGVLVTPLGNLFGWSRGEVTLALTFSAVSSILLNPFMGELVDRVGARIVALVGAPLCALGMGLIGLSGPHLFSWYAAWAFYSVLQVAGSPVVWASVVSKTFRASRGMALGVTLCGAGVGTMVFPRLDVWLLDRFGWQGVYIGCALLNVALLFPLAFYFLPRTRRAKGVSFLRERPSETRMDPQTAPVQGMEVRHALRTTLFWRLGFLVVVTGAAVSALNVHLQPLMTDHGLSRAAAAAIVAEIGPAVIIGRLISGMLLDRIHARWIAMFFMALPAVGCLLLMNFHGNHPRALLATIGVGLASGAEGDLVAVMVSRYFGMRRFGTIYGLAISLYACGYALAPPAAGMLYDRMGSYDAGLIGLSVALFMAVVVAATFDPYPDHGGSIDDVGGPKAGNMSEPPAEDFWRV